MFAWQKRFSLQLKIALVFAAIQALMLAYYSGSSIVARVADERQKIDTELTLAAHAYLIAVGEEKISKALNNSLPEPESLAETAKMGRLANELDLAYLYSVYVVESTVRYVIDGAPQSDIDDGKFSLPGADYDDASPKILEAWNTGIPQFDNYSDSFGTFRSYFMPLTTSIGDTVVVCADIRIDYVRQKTISVYLAEIALALAFLAASTILAFIFAKRLAKPIIGD
jgi:methyl-accepting chemotaxis protein